MSVFSSSSSLGKLSPTDVSAYLTRLNLPTSLLGAPPSLALLRQVQLAHHLTIPFESTILHVPSNSWTGDPSRAIRIGESDESVALGAAAFDRIVRKRKGGYCFSLNSTLAALLRHWFKVSDVAARVYGHLGDNDPAEVGWSWISLKDGGEPTPGTTPCPRFKVVHSTLPTNDSSPLPSTVALDEPKTWTCYREVTPSTGRPKFWTPYYTFLLQLVTYPDFVVLNHYNSTYPSALFKTFFVCTKLHEDGSRTTLYYKNPVDAKGGDGSSEGCAKLQRTTLAGAEVREESVPMRIGPIRAVLEEDFGFVFE
ncbi:hypothetical protein RQP46_010357 [Phenoliferia psychrophenolica]